MVYPHEPKFCKFCLLVLLNYPVSLFPDIIYLLPLEDIPETISKVETV